MNMIEIWRAIPGYPGYEISNEGHVRRVFNSHVRTAFSQVNEYICAKRMRVNLRSPNGKFTNKRIDGFVLLAFHSISIRGKKVYYKDGDFKNCSLDNLDVRPLKKIEHRNYVQNRDGWRGYKLSREQVQQIIELRANGATLQQIADLYGIDQSYVSLIKDGKRANGKATQ